jgi:hypothetical protein
MPPDVAEIAGTLAFLAHDLLLVLSTPELGLGDHAAGDGLVVGQEVVAVVLLVVADAAAAKRRAEHRVEQPDVHARPLGSDLGDSALLCAGDIDRSRKRAAVVPQPMEGPDLPGGQDERQDLVAPAWAWEALGDLDRGPVLRRRDVDALRQGRHREDGDIDGLVTKFDGGLGRAPRNLGLVVELVLGQHLDAVDARVLIHPLVALVAEEDEVLDSVDVGQPPGGLGPRALAADAREMRPLTDGHRALLALLHRQLVRASGERAFVAGQREEAVGHGVGDLLACRHAGAARCRLLSALRWAGVAPVDGVRVADLPAAVVDDDLAAARALPEAFRGSRLRGRLRRIEAPRRLVFFVTG